MNKIVKLVLLFLIAVVAASCEEDPSSVGKDLLAGQDITTIYTLDSRSDGIEQSSSTYIDTISLGFSNRTLIGKTEQMTAKGVIKFSFVITSALKTEITNNELTPVKAYISLTPDYSFGNTADPFGINLHKVTSSWDSDNFKQNDLEQIQYNSSPFSSNFVSSNDTLFTMDLENEVVFEWLKSGVDTTIKNYGALFVPTPETNRIFGFPTLTSSASTSNLPSITLIVKNASDEFDTLSATPSYDAFGVSGSLPGDDENFLYVQGGIPIHSSIKFDVSSLPKNAIIIEANLTFTRDSLQAVNGSVHKDSLVVSLLKEESGNGVDLSVASMLLKKSGNTYTGNINTFAQYWVDQKINHGIKIRLYGDDEYVNRIALYSSKVNDVLLKPRLQIIYADIK